MMLHSIRLSLAAAALTLAAPATAAETIVLDFDDLRGTGLVPAEYRGVVFGDGFSHYDTPDPDFPPVSGLTTVYTNYAKFRPGTLATVTFSFDELVRFDGAFFSGKAPVQYEFLRGGQSVAVGPAFALDGEARFYASGLSTLVDEVRLTGISGDWVMDDLTFTTGVVSAIPEPAAWAAMIIGFGLIGTRLRASRIDPRTTLV